MRILKMSDIRGNGYGSDHAWRFIATRVHGPGAGNKFTEDECKDCKAYFRHFYDRDSDIFKAIKDWKIPEYCGDKDE
jgi:hypothetical protein